MNCNFNMIKNDLYDFFVRTTDYADFNDYNSNRVLNPVRVDAVDNILIPLKNYVLSNYRHSELVSDFF